MKKMYFVLIMLPTAALGIFERDNASVLAQQEQWKQANDKLQKLVVQNYDNPDLLYDAGVTLFKTSAFEQACAYFQQVKEHEKASSSLKEQACFNLGNSCVELNKLEDAIEQYQAALDINPKNEWAKHNLERVKEMLRQQEQQEQQNQDQNQDKEQNKGQQDQQGQNQNQGQQNQNNDSSGNQQQSSQQQGGDQQNQSDQNKNEHGEQQNDDSQEQSESAKDEHQQRNADSSTDQHGEQQQKQNQEQNTEKENEGNRDQQTQDDSQENKADQKQDKKLDHMVNPTQQQMAQQSSTPQDQDMQESEKTQREAQVAEENDDEAVDLKDKWLVQVLQEREKSDKKATKQIMKATIDNQLAGKHGQNCW